MPNRAGNTAPVLLLAAFAMLAFAGNSLLARLALSQTSVDPSTFTAVRLASGALFLWGFSALRGRLHPMSHGRWLSACALFLYAVAFSFAYIRLDTGTGALILFGTVQISMLCYGFSRGERLTPVQWLAFVMACGGVVYLMLPGASAPSIVGSSLMVLSGISWAVYTLSAGNTDPVSASTGNFVRTLPLCVLLCLINLPNLELNMAGISYALMSGVFTSAIGYIAWYWVLPQITVLSASTMQLSVPALAALMGVWILDESLTIRLVIAASVILLGVAIVLRSKHRVKASED